MKYSEQFKKQLVEEILNGATHAEVSKKYGVGKRSLIRWKKRAIVSQELIHQAPLGHYIKGVSKLVDKDGNLKQQWIKTDRDFDETHAMMENVVASMKEDIPPTEPIKGPDVTNDQLLSLYVITDYHFGMLSRKAETGEEWSIETAEKTLLDWFERAIETTPDSHTAVLGQLGDMLHYDGLKAITPSHGHVLDTEAKFPEIIIAVIRVFRKIVKRLLEKHEYVHILMAEGNHDLASSAWLRTFFYTLYEDEPRVTVDQSMIPYYCFEWGKVSLFFHHGHCKNFSMLAKVFAAEFREVFGRTKFSYGHSGHLHHEKTIEDSLMILCQHQTLSPNDSHSKRGGYHSERSATVTVYHKEFGEVTRIKIRPEIPEN